MLYHPTIPSKILHPSTQLTFKHRRIHIIAAPLCYSDSLYNRLYAILADHEKKKAEAINLESTHREYVISRALLRLLLAWHSNNQASQVILKAGRYGKLYQVGGRLFFNLAHSHQWMLLALSASYILGIDIEKHRTLVSQKTIGNHLGHNQSLSLEETLWCWCRTESVIKAYGASIMHGKLSLPYTLKKNSWWMWKRDVDKKIRATTALPKKLTPLLYIRDLPLTSGWYGSVSALGVWPPSWHFWLLPESSVAEAVQNL